MKNVIIEGARGLGKSTIARWLRENTTNSTLINFTGFNEKGEEGLHKVTTYYNRWNSMFKSMRGEDFLFIHDRYFFSEFVYSKIYKDYSFDPIFYNYMQAFPRLFDEVVLVVLWTDDSKELARNLNRDKVQLFGREIENVDKSLIQQVGYLKMANDLKNMKVPNLKIHVLDVTGKSIDEIGKEILSL